MPDEEQGSEIKRHRDMFEQQVRGGGGGAAAPNNKIEVKVWDNMNNMLKEHGQPTIKTPAPAQPDLFQPAVRIFGEENSRPALNHSVKCVGPTSNIREHFFEIAEHFIVYSAYYDRRHNDFDNRHNSTFIRMMAVLRQRHRPEAKCQFPLPYGTVTTPISYYEMCENHGRMWGGYILSCEVPLEVSDLGMPCSFRVSVEEGPLSEPIHLYVLQHQPSRRRFTMCVPPLFGHVNIHKLIEFIEASHLVGAEHIYFYNFKIEEDVMNLLKYYVSLGLVTVVNWQIPDMIDRVIWYHGQIIGIQDCLYRNMAWSDYVMFNDIDEVLVTHRDSSWEDLVRVEDSPSLAAFQFHSAFFPVVEADHGTPHQDLLLLSSTTRTESLSKIRTKCLVKPTNIFEKGIHHVSKPITAFMEVRRMDQADVALLHHYRNCMPNFGMNCKRMVEDETLVSRIADRLMENVKLTKSKVFQHNS